ncbi:hypothetical protein TEA_002698 [Camellia sinensis var. sinensis]|uniref:Serine O-acetyltransferase n=1 Tax=Camellia sinensis var. sinensis TaxID=542762 RepID=A0A4S4D9W6_CAMSN|nr:hypothetical protein TEA_002698 [Camellia sinensis var. sinensis]
MRGEERKRDRQIERQERRQSKRWRSSIEHVEAMTRGIEVGDRCLRCFGRRPGGTGKEIGDRHPKVRQGALIGASATILGNIEIGEGAMIAAGSLVLKNVTPHSMVAGIPAKVIGYVDEQDPSLTMKHDANKEFFEHVAVSCMEGRSSGGGGGSGSRSIGGHGGRGNGGVVLEVMVAMVV